MWKNLIGQIKPQKELEPTAGVPHLNQAAPSAAPSAVVTPVVAPVAKFGQVAQHPGRLTWGQAMALRKLRGY